MNSHEVKARATQAGGSRRRRDATIDWTKPVSVIAIERRPDGGSIRDVLKSVWIRTFVCPAFSGGNVVAEGENERRAIWHEKFVRRAKAFVSQPERIVFEIDSQIVGAEPDYRVEGPESSHILEVKGITAVAYKPWLPRKLEAVKRAYAEAGYSYEFVTSTDLRRQPLAGSVAKIWSAKRVPVGPDIRDRVADVLSKGPALYGDLQRLLRDGDPRRILAMHADGCLTIDLKAGPITAASPVYPGAVDLGSYAEPLP